MVRVHLYITGIVQGVFYRQTTKKQATELGLKGWVRNLDDGRVEALVEGEEEKVNQLIKWSHRGPENARVEKVDIEDEDYTGEFVDFSIR